LEGGKLLINHQFGNLYENSSISVSVKLIADYVAKKATNETKQTQKYFVKLMHRQPDKTVIWNASIWNFDCFLCFSPETCDFNLRHSTANLSPCNICFWPSFQQLHFYLGTDQHGNNKTCGKSATIRFW